MKNIELYQSWHDNLLSAVRNRVCMTCSDERKKQHSFNYDNPLNCSCPCNRVENILENVKNIEDDIGEYLKFSH